MKDRCGFLFVHYKRHCCIELVSWEHTACLLSVVKKRPLVGGSLNTSSVVISFGATASVHYREVVRSWEGPLREVPLCCSTLRAPCCVLLQEKLGEQLRQCKQCQSFRAQLRVLKS